VWMMNKIQSRERKFSFFKPQLSTSSPLASVTHKKFFLPHTFAHCLHLLCTFTSHLLNSNSLSPLIGERRSQNYSKHTKKFVSDFLNSAFMFW
jgi:hypothetical protein